MVDRPAPGAPADALSAELIAHRGFTVSRRGFEQDEVKEFLQLVAGAVRRLHERVAGLETALADAEHRVANPRLDEDTLLRMVGEETGSILRSARAAAAEMSATAERTAQDMREAAVLESAELRAAAETETATLRAAVETETASLRAAAETETAALRAALEREITDLRSRAEAEAAKVVDEARQVAGDLRNEAESVLGRYTDEAEQVAARIRSTAQETATQVVERARNEAEALRHQAEHDRKLTVEGAQAVREKILGDLNRRRRVASTQIEQLRAGRERLLESYAVVRRTLEEVNDDLHRADAEAREAAAAAGRAFEESFEDDVVAPDLLAGPSALTEAAVTGAGATQAAVMEAGATEAGATEAPRTEGSVAAGEPAEVEAPVAAVAEPGLSDAEALEKVTAPPAALVVAEIVDVEEPGRAVADDDRAGGEVASAPSDPPESSPPGAVDDLFARIRAGRQDAVAHALEVLDETPAAETPVGSVPAGSVPAGSVPAGSVPASPAPADAVPADAVSASPAPADAVPAAKAAPAAGARAAEAPAAEAPASGRRSVGRGDQDLEPPRSDEEEAWLQKRDQALGETETALTRKLKRALQDEQNDLLDRLRSLRGRPTAGSLLPSAREQESRFVRAASTLVEQGSRKGAEFAVQLMSGLGQRVRPPAKSAPVEDVSAELAAAIVTPLRRRLEQTIDESADDDQAVLVEALGGAYREWKTQRIERIAGDALATAFARGTLHATPKTRPLRWVVDDIDGPCSDCDDNVLAGAIPKDEEFPTGQAHPPAHAGCRCILVPAT